MLAVLLGGAATAAPRTLAIAVGDCRETELLGSMMVFSEAIRARLGEEMVDPSAVLAKLRPRPQMSLEDIQRMLDAAQTQFYSVQYEKAAENVRQALEELERVSVTAKPWRLTQAALTLNAMILRSTQRRAEANESFRRILRVDPRFKLDPDYYTPATRAHFDQVQREMARAPKTSLTVLSTPAGADVFLDGALVGKTPFKGQFPTGSYRLALARGEAASFARPLQLDQDASVQVDLDFESSLRSQPPLCISAGSAHDGLDNPLKLAAFLGVEEMVVLRVRSANAEPGWATAVLVDVNQGTRVREGGMKASAAPKSDSLVELADFVLTGQVSRGVVAIRSEPAQRSAEKPVPLARATDVPGGGEPAVNVGAPEPGLTTVSEPAPGAGGSPRWLRAGRFVALGVGGAAAAAGAAVWLSGSDEREKLGQHLDADGNLPPRDSSQRPEADRLHKSVDDSNRLALGLAIGAAAAVASGVVMWVMAPGPDDASLRLTGAVTPDAAGVWVSGRF